jgi:hypothetical protein
MMGPDPLVPLVLGLKGILANSFGLLLILKRIRRGL